MLAIGSKVFNRPKDLEIAKRLAETCYWLYTITKTGIGAEVTFFKVGEQSKYWPDPNLPDGIDGLSPSYYILRPGKYLGAPNWKKKFFFAAFIYTLLPCHSYCRNYRESLYTL